MTDIPRLGTSVIYRSRTGAYDVPATVNCTQRSIYPPGVEGGFVPALTGDDHVHLTVMTPGLPGCRKGATDFLVTSPHPVGENVAGCYQEWDIPYDPAGGPGTWRWTEERAALPEEIQEPEEASPGRPITAGELGLCGPVTVLP